MCLGKQMEHILLTRDQFRELVFDRDKYKCVVCGEAGKDAHHITERRLFPDEGYYLDNGATLCEVCHHKAEETIISTKEIIQKLGISRCVLPPHLYEDQDYDKWGNSILPNGTRLAGELFDDDGVRKALVKVKHLFVSKIKYPRTYHLPFSLSVTSTDRCMENCYWLQGYRVIVTEKMDGENTSWYRDSIHARSLDYEPHPSRSLIKAMWSEHAHDIPERFRICGENLYSKHSISYNNLSSYFQIFGVWDGLTCLSWNDTCEWAKLLDLTTVPVLYEGIWNEKLIMDLALGLDKDKQEGLVVRRADAIHMKEWRYRVGKFVRENHVQTDEHWMRQRIIPNKIGE